MARNTRVVLSMMNTLVFTAVLLSIVEKCTEFNMYSLFILFIFRW